MYVAAIVETEKDRTDWTGVYEDKINEIGMIYDTGEPSLRFFTRLTECPT